MQLYIVPADLGITSVIGMVYLELHPFLSHLHTPNCTTRYEILVSCTMLEEDCLDNRSLPDWLNQRNLKKSIIRGMFVDDNRIYVIKYLKNKIS